MIKDFSQQVRVLSQVPLTSRWYATAQSFWCQDPVTCYNIMQSQLSLKIQTFKKCLHKQCFKWGVFREVTINFRSIWANLNNADTRSCPEESWHETTLWNITLKELCLLSYQEVCVGGRGERGSVSGIPPLNYVFLKIKKPCCHSSNRKHVWTSWMSKCECWGLAPGS